MWQSRVEIEDYSILQLLIISCLNFFAFSYKQILAKATHFCAERDFDLHGIIFDFYPGLPHTWVSSDLL